MSLSLLARANRIDSEASRLTLQASRLNSQLATLTNEVNAFAAFMHTDPLSEFTQQDRDKYSDDFMDKLTSIQTTLSGLGALSMIESGAISVAEFIAQYTGEDPVEYSKRFDKG